MTDRQVIPWKIGDERCDRALELREGGATLRQIAEYFGVSVERARQLDALGWHRRRQAQERQRNPGSCAGMLSIRTYNALRNGMPELYVRKGTEYVAPTLFSKAQVLPLVNRLGRSDMLRTKNLGPKGLRELETWLGIEFK